MPAQLLPLALQIAAWTTGASIADYDCNAPRGSFAKQELTGNGSSFRVGGTIKPTGIGRGGNQWLPAAGVLFQPEEGKGGIGLQLWQSSRKTLAFGLRRLGPNADTPVPLGTLPLEDPIRFTLELGKDGRMQFTVNDKAFALPKAGIQPTHPILMCSGGHFSFEGLTTATQ